MIAAADTLTDPRAVMVEARDAVPTVVAVAGAQRHANIAQLAPDLWQDKVGRG